MYTPYNRYGIRTCPRRLKSPNSQTDYRLFESDSIDHNLPAIGRLWPVLVMLTIFGVCLTGARAQQVEPSLPISQRFTINLAAGVPEYLANAASASNAPQSQWWFQNINNSATYSTPGFVESTDTAATWTQVGSSLRCEYSAHFYQPDFRWRTGIPDWKLQLVPSAFQGRSEICGPEVHAEYRRLAHRAFRFSSTARCCPA
jgi:hypothetical protein